MDVTQDLADYAVKHTTSTIERSEPAVVDAGLLAAFDNTPVDPEQYSTNLEPHLLSLALTSTQTLLSALFQLPTHSSTDAGPTVTLPAPITILPREKPLPKPKPPTKWERFAKAKGISHKRKEKDVWDDDKQEWVSRWGRGGKNREKEDVWLSEVKAGADPEENPALRARADRKARIAKNTAQHSRNLAQASAQAQASTSRPESSTSTQSGKAAVRAQRKTELDRSLLISRTSTASLGKFDKAIEGEPKPKGVKRKFEANIGDIKGEKEAAMGILKAVERGEGKKAKGRKGGEGEEGGVNYRKAVRFEGREERRVGGGRGGGRGGRGGRGGGGRGRGRK